MQKGVDEVPVLIVGAGAGGLATAAMLAKYGVESLVVEKRSEVYLYPKARNLSFRSLEILRGLGLQHVVHAVSAGVPAMVVKPTLNSAEEKPAIEMDTVFADLAELSPEPVIQHCPQSRLEPILADYVRGRASQVRYGTELTSFKQDATGVSATLRDRTSARCTEVRARYLVAADGVHSPTRDMLGVSTRGHGALPIYVVFIYFRAPWGRLVPHLDQEAAVQVVNSNVNGIFIAADEDLGMFTTTYFPDQGDTAEQFDEQRCRELLLAVVGEPIDVDIIEVAPWQPHELVADQFRCGRVFLVGDSAHAMPPFKAGGANVAIQSADNLAWKLAAVLQGWAGDGLLDTYDTERRPVGAFSARQSLTGPTVQLLDLGRRGPHLPADEEVSMFALLAGYQYTSPAVITEGAPQASSGVQMVSALRGQPGTRVPHVWVADHGRRVSTLDLLGPGLTLLTGDDGAHWVPAVHAARVPITVRCIGSRDPIVDADHAWATITQMTSAGALLVRPDGFIAARFDTPPPDPGSALREVVAVVLALDSTRRRTSCGAARTSGQLR